MKATGVAIAAILVIVALGCGKGEDEYYQHAVDLAGQPPEVAYVALKCASCHGPDRAGQRTAPSLTGLAGRWDQPTLIEYLRDPKAMQAKTPRLAYLAERYPIEMPAYAHTDEQVLQGLTALLLAD
jgi:mono/diheme cytochrome c family protein